MLRQFKPVFLRHFYALVFVIKQIAFGFVSCVTPSSHALMVFFTPGSSIVTTVSGTASFHVPHIFFMPTIALSAVTAAAFITSRPISLPTFPFLVTSDVQNCPAFLTFDVTRNGKVGRL